MRVAHVLCVAGVVSGCQPAPAFREVAVVGNEYSFTAPDTVPAGRTVFAFENRGKRRHEMGLTMLRPGVTFRDVTLPDSLRAPEDSVYGPDVGVLLTRPGVPSGGKLMADLESGQTYLLWCDLRDSPGQVRHSDMGMLHLLVVR